MDQKNSAVALQDKTLTTLSRKSPELAKVIAVRQANKFAQMTPVEFTQLLLRLCVLVGCAEPSAEGALILHEHCAKMHPRDTDKSLLLAAEMNAAGKFLERIEHFNSMDAVYIGKLLGAFELHHRKAIQESMKGIEEEPQKEITQDEREAIFEDMLKKDLEAYKAGKFDELTATFTAARIVGYLEEKGRMIETSDDLIDSIKKRAVSNVRKAMDVSESRIARWKSEARFKNQYYEYRNKVITEQYILFYKYYLSKQVTR